MAFQHARWVGIAAVSSVLVQAGCSRCPEAYMPEPCPDAASAAPGGALLREDFAAYPVGEAFTDGEEFGVWHIDYAGYGEVRIVEDGERRFLSGAPRAATSPDATHAFMVLGPNVAPPFRLELELRTRQQLRQNSQPNPWEVGWVVWGHQDDDNFEYFIPKPNGWERGRVAGEQEVLHATEETRFETGVWHRVRLDIREDGTTSIYVGGRHIADHPSDPASPGHIGLYAEDALVDYAAIRISTLPRDE